MINLSVLKRNNKQFRFGAFVVTLSGLMAVAQGQTSSVNPGIYSLPTAYPDFAGRGSLEFNPPTRSNVSILGNSSPIAREPVRATNPWAAVLGQPQPFELNYNVDTGALSWSLLGATLTANYSLQAGYGLAYILPSVKVQTPTGAANNSATMSNLLVSVNGGTADSYSPLSVSGNGFNSKVIYFTNYNIHTVKVTGNLMFDMPEAWSSEINGTFGDVQFASAKPVPEPATLAALGFGAVALLRRRKGIGK